MKKFFVFAAAAALLLGTASCNKIDSNRGAEPAFQKELTFNSVSFTKGYVTGAVFYDTAVEQMHLATPATTPRSMWLSAYLTPQDGSAVNYFVNEKFDINANGESDNLWHHSPKLYWPLDGTLSFLAYSAKTQLTGTNCVWDDANAANKLILNMSEAQSQDDVVYAAVANNSSSSASVPMVFNHTQAWIEFDIKANTADLITVKDITLNNIYMKGELTINGGVSPSHSWDFRSFSASDYPMESNFVSASDLFYEYDTAVPTTSRFLDMLIPAQSQTSFVITYTLAGQSNLLTYKYDMNTASWEAGKKYVYSITFDPQEITVTPSVTTFSVADVSGDGFPSTLN